VSMDDPYNRPETHPPRGCVSIRSFPRGYFFAAFTGSFTASNVANSTL